MSYAQTPAPQHSHIRALRMFATVIALAAVAFVCTAVLPQRAYAYSRNANGAIGKVTGKKYGNVYYGTSVSDVMSIVDDMISTRRNPCHEDEVTIDLLADWNTKDYGRIKVPNGYTFHINLHGHMINRGRALELKSSDKWYGSGSGEVIYVDGGTLYLNGGTGTDVDAHMHTGYFEDGTFWKYDAGGWPQAAIYGGLITGGACDDWHGAGGISLARDTSRAYITNTTIAGNITDQYDSRYGHGAGIAVHGSKCTLELDNVTVKCNHAEGYGGGIYVRNSDCALNIKNSKIDNNHGGKHGGGIYLDDKATLNLENSTVDGNYTGGNGAGIYANASNTTINLKTSSDKSERVASMSKNYAAGHGGGIYADGTATINFEGVTCKENKAAYYKGSSILKHNGGCLYLNGNKSKLSINNCSLIANSSFDGYGGALFIDGNDTEVVVNKSTIDSNSASSRGGGIYHNGKNGSVKFTNSSLSKNTADLDGGGFYSYYDGTEFTFTDSAIVGNLALACGGGAYFNDVTTLTLKNTQMKDNNAGHADYNTNGKGGGVYNTDSGSRIYLEGNSSICSNHANSKNRDGSEGIGGGIYSEKLLTVTSSDGTGTIRSNTSSGNGGGIWFSSSLYLDNVSITENAASTHGGGIYCDNTSYKDFELARTIVVNKNTANDKDSNLYLRKEQTFCSATGDRALSTSSKIGVEAQDYSGEGKRKVSGNQVLMKALGEKYTDVFVSDNYDYSISADGSYVYIDPTNSRVHYYKVKMGTWTSESKSSEDGAEITLKSEDYLKQTERQGDFNNRMERCAVGRVDYWTVTDDLGERTIPVKDGVATFALRGSDAVVVSHVIRPIGSIGLKVNDSATWNELTQDSTSTVSLSYLNFRERLWTLLYEYHNDWIKDHSTGEMEDYSDGTGQFMHYDWWDDDPSSGTELVRKVNTSDDSDAYEYNYGFDNIKEGDAAKSASSVTRTFVGYEKSEDGTITGAKVKYTVTLNKSLYESMGMFATDSNAAGLLAFEAIVSGDNIETQRVNDQEDVTYRASTYKTQSCTTSADADGNQVVSFEVVIPRKMVTVTFNAGEDAVLPEDAKATITLDAGSSLDALPTPTREGYDFAGWYLGTAGETETKVSESTTFSKDTILYAKWTKHEEEGKTDTTRYRLVLYLAKEDGEDDWSTVDVGLAVFVDESAKTAQLTKPEDPTYEGYTFEGWYTDEALTQAFEFNDKGVGTVEYADGDLVLYAKWSKSKSQDTHTVTFANAEGKTLATVSDVADGATVKIPAAAAAAVTSGNALSSWVISGTGQTFAPASTNSKGEETGTAVTSNLTLVSSLKEVTHTVMYKNGSTATDEAAVALTASNDDAEDNIATMTVVDGATAPNIELADLDHYDFDGWYKDATCTEPYDFETETVTEDNLTLYAKWTPVVLVNFETSGGSEVASLRIPAGTKLAASDLPDSTRENYRFRGWNGEDGKQVPDELTINEDTTLTARWLGNTVFARLHNIYSEDEKHIEFLHYGNAITKNDVRVNIGHDDPVRAGYTFCGWYADEECTEEFEFGQTLEGDVDLYAKWEQADSFTVSFDSNGGSPVDAQAVTGGELATEPEAPTKDGYVFDGWFTDKACTEAYTFEDEVTENVTLYAKWAEAVTITLDSTGGELTSDTVFTVAKGSPVGVLPVPRRGTDDRYNTPSADDGYVFGGWYTADGTKVTAESTFDEDTTLVAYWERNGEVCFVTYISCGEMLDYDIVKTGDKLKQPADPTRVGYTFTGWYTDEACTKAYDFNTAVTSDFKLYAGWKEADGSGKQDGKQDGVDKKGGKKLPGTGDNSLFAVAAVAATGLTAAAVGLVKRRRN